MTGPQRKREASTDFDARPTIVLDWDGTMVPAVWPESPTEWMPGAVEAVKRLNATGKFQFVVFSARLNPYEYMTNYSQRRQAAHVKLEVKYIRDMLDEAGLDFVGIHTKAGKPTGDVYIDDKAERYNGNPNSWAYLADKIISRFEEAS